MRVGVPGFPGQESLAGLWLAVPAGWGLGPSWPGLFGPGVGEARLSARGWVGAWTGGEGGWRILLDFRCPLGAQEVDRYGAGWRIDTV